MRLAQLFALVMGAGAGCGKAADGPGGPVAGTVVGSDFDVVGTRSQHVDSYTVLTLTNTPATCGMHEVPNNGVIVLAISVPNGMLVPGTYPVGRDVKLGVTKIIEPVPGNLSFDAISLSSGTVTLVNVGPQIEGKLSTTDGDVSLSGSFAVPLCP
jgi:hypothetical protein